MQTSIKSLPCLLAHHQQADKTLLLNKLPVKREDTEPLYPSAPRHYLKSNLLNDAHRDLASINHNQTRGGIFGSNCVLRTGDAKHLCMKLGLHFAHKSFTNLPIVGGCTISAGLRAVLWVLRGNETGLEVGQTLPHGQEESLVIR